MHVFVPAQRDGTTNMINNAMTINATDKLRLAQDLALYNLELSEQLPDFDGNPLRTIRYEAAFTFWGYEHRALVIVAMQRWKT